MNRSRAFQASIQIKCRFDRSSKDLISRTKWHGPFQSSCHIWGGKGKIATRNIMKTPDTFCRPTSLECVDAIGLALYYRKDILSLLRKDESALETPFGWTFLTFIKRVMRPCTTWVGTLEETFIYRTVRSRLVESQLSISIDKFMSPFLGLGVDAALACLHEAGLKKRGKSMMVDLSPTFFALDDRYPASSCLLEASLWPWHRVKTLLQWRSELRKFNRPPAPLHLPDDQL
jgi:hypothetical protein